MDFWISFANFFASAIRLTAPIALGTLACTISERAGVINIGIEGTMLFSGFLAAAGAYYTGSPWVGLLCGCAAGAFLALILGVLAIYCNGQQIVIGIGLNLFGPGFAYMLMRALWDTTGISPWVEGFQAVNIPFLSRVPIAGTMLRAKAIKPDPADISLTNTLAELRHMTAPPMPAKTPPRSTARIRRR